MTVDINYVQNLTKDGQVYNDLDPKVVAARNHALKTVRAYNNKVYHQNDYDYQLLRPLFKHLGAFPYIEPNFYCEFGFNLSIGDNFLLQKAETDYFLFLLAKCPSLPYLNNLQHEFLTIGRYHIQPYIF